MMGRCGHSDLYLRNPHSRCGATMVKEIERAGIPVVHIATVVPISLTVGANCIVPAIAIPHPLGNPALTMEEEKRNKETYTDQGSDSTGDSGYRADCI